MIAAVLGMGLHLDGIGEIGQIFGHDLDIADLARLHIEGMADVGVHPQAEAVVAVVAVGLVEVDACPAGAVELRIALGDACGDVEEIESVRRGDEGIAISLFGFISRVHAVKVVFGGHADGQGLVGQALAALVADIVPVRVRVGGTDGLRVPLSADGADALGNAPIALAAVGLIGHDAGGGVHGVRGLVDVFAIGKVAVPAGAEVQARRGAGRLAQEFGRKVVVMIQILDVQGHVRLVAGAVIQHHVIRLSGRQVPDGAEPYGVFLLIFVGAVQEFAAVGEAFGHCRVGIEGRLVPTVAALGDQEVGDAGFGRDEGDDQGIVIRALDERDIQRVPVFDSIQEAFAAVDADAVFIQLVLEPSDGAGIDPAANGAGVPGDALGRAGRRGIVVSRLTAVIVDVIRRDGNVQRFAETDVRRPARPDEAVGLPARQRDGGLAVIAVVAETDAVFIHHVYAAAVVGR